MLWDIQRGGPWGGSGGNGGGQGPWGGGGGSSGNQPPDIEEMLRRSQDKFKKFIPISVQRINHKNIYLKFLINGMAHEY